MTVTYVDALRYAVDQAAQIIEDGAADKGVATDGDVELARAALISLRPSTEEVDALARVAALGNEYMVNSGYGEHPGEALEAAVMQQLGDNPASTASDVRRFFTDPQSLMS